MSNFEKLRNLFAKKVKKMGSLHYAAVSKKQKTGPLQPLFWGFGRLRKIDFHFMEKVGRNFA